MTYTLVIVESPAKCGKIEGFLGPGYKCMASYGHIQQLSNLKNIDMENNFKPTFEYIDAKKMQITKLRKAITESNNVMLATDDDREGEAIAWHICEVFNLSIHHTPRIIFHEITKDAIVRAVNSPTTLNMHIVHAQQSRQILDLIVGYKISPLLWKHISRNSKKGLSAGRCQTPALRLIYDNQKDIDQSPGKKAYNTTGYFTKLNIPFVLNYHHEEKMETFLEESVNFEHKFSCSKPKNTTKKPPIPFTTSTLQQKASNEMNISPKETMAISQKLYEGGYITYMRTDSTTYSKEFLEKTKVYITDKYDNKYVNENIDQLSERKVEKKTTKKKKKEEEKNAQEAHEAIRPTNIKLEKVPDDMSPREKKLYYIIWSNTLESCMSDAKYLSITSKITAPDSYEYRYSSEQVEFPGWKIVKGYEKENPIYNLLLLLKNDTNIDYKKITSKVSIKELKTHYTEAKLVQLLEEKGIGRPSTFSSLIDKIQEREYALKENVKGKKIKCVDYELIDDELEEKVDNREFGNEKNKLVIQPLGMMVLEFLLKYYENLFSYDYTKNMENNLDLIAKGNKIWYDLCRECLDEVDNVDDEVKQNNKNTIQLDNEHIYMIGKYGPVVKKGHGETATFLSVKKDLDFEKLKNNKYSLQEIVEKKTDSIYGKYQDKDLYLKKGKFGHYVTWGDNKKSIQNININIDDLTLQDIINHIENETSTNLNMIRIIDENLSIRNGKFGHYIYYKTNKMKTPKFLKLKGFTEDYKTCSIEVLKNWISQEYINK